MNAIGQWLIRMVAISILCSIAESVMPSGGVRQVGKLTCGLVILWVLMSPIVQLSPEQGLDWVEDYQTQLEVTTQELERQVEQDRKGIIEQQCGTYIEDKAAQLGVVCTAEVTCRMGEEGLYLPESARLRGVFTDVEQSQLTKTLQEELGIPAERQTYIIEEDVR